MHVGGREGGLGLARVVHSHVRLEHDVQVEVLAHGGHGAVVWAQVRGHGVVLVLVQVCGKVWHCCVFVLRRTSAHRTETWL